MSDRYEGRTMGPIPLDYDNAFKLKRHPCEVTADRLLDHLEKYPERFNGTARDEIAHIRFLLQEIAGD